jgi:NTE family protein
MMKARPSMSPREEVASLTRQLHDTSWLAARFPDLRDVPQPLLQELIEVVELRHFGPGALVHSDDPEDGFVAGLRLVFDGEVMVTRTATSGASARVFVLGVGAVFSEEDLEPLLQELAPSVTTRGRADAVTYDEVRQSLGLSAVPGSQSVPGASRVDTTVSSVMGLITVDALKELAHRGGSDWTVEQLVTFLVRIYQVNRYTDRALDALPDVEGLGRLSESERWWLLEGAGYCEWEAGHEEMAKPGYLYLLLTGEVEVFAEESFSCMVLKPGPRCVLPLHADSPEVRVRASLPSRLLLISGERLAALLRRNAGFRRKVMHSTLPSSQIGQTARTIDDGHIEVIGLARHPDLGLPVSDEALVGLLAQAIHTQFNDLVVVVRVEPSETGEPVIEDLPPRHGVDQIVVRATPDKAVEMLIRAREEAARRYDYALLDLSAWSRPPAPLQLLVHKWAFVVAHPLQRVGVERTLEAPVVPTVCVLQQDQATAREHCGSGGALSMPLRNTRLSLHDEDFVGRRMDPDLALETVPRSRPSLERWARAMTDRLVGVALGGGGALGLSHLPLLEGMHKRGIPVDVVSGTSFGAVVGGYYCGVEAEAGAETHPGLQKLRALLPRLTGIALTCMLNSKLLEEVVDADLGGILLEASPIPFIPVSTNAGTMSPVFPAGCSVGHGVWASGALPPVFSAPENQEAQVRFLDGAFVANVPADILVAAGASLIVACNPISPPLYTAGWADRLENVFQVLRTPDLHPRDRQVALRAATMGQMLDLGRLERTPMDDVSRLAMAWGRMVSSLAERSAGGLDRVYPTLRAAWDRVRPRRVPDAVRGVQALASQIGADTSRRSNVISSPPLSILAAAKFWRGEDIIGIAERALLASDTLDQVEAEWRRLERPVRVPAPEE